MAKTHRSETTWKAPKTSAYPNGGAYVLKHTSETPITIRLCIGGSVSDLGIEEIDALITDLCDAQSVIASPEKVPLPIDPPLEF